MNAKLPLLGIIRAVWILCLSTFSLPSNAANWLASVQESKSLEGVTKVDIGLLQPTQLTTNFSRVGDNTYQARAELDKSVSNLDWQFVELLFEEESRFVVRVSLEGAKAKGFLLTVEFADEVEVVETKLQRNLQLVELAVVTPQVFDALIADDTGASGYAVEFLESTVLTSQSLPKVIIDSKFVYGAPLSTEAKRIGFYPTETAARVALRGIRGAHPSAHVVEVSAGEVNYASAIAFRPVGQRPGVPLPTQEPAVQTRAVTPSTIDEEDPPPKVVVEFTPELDRSLLDAARAAYLARDWPGAIDLYARAAGEPRLREEALERLGVTYERGGAPDKAQQTYENFLVEYPEGASASRVRQRLASLVGSDRQRTTFREAGRKRQKSWRTLARISQFYRQHAYEVDGTEKRIPVDALFTDISALARKQTNDGYHEARVALGHIEDFSDEDDQADRSSQPDFRVLRAHWESYVAKSRLGFKIGRQSRNRSGVLGRFDGIAVSYGLSSNVQWNVVGGNVVQSSYDDTSADRPFYGVSVDLKFLDGRVEVSPFVIEQEYDGVLDRRAVGTDLFWTTDSTVVSALIDYDLHHEALNNFYVMGAYNLNENWRVHGAYDLRRSPYLTTSNALIGQPISDLSDLEQELLNLELTDIAEDRTATSTTIRAGLDGTLSDTWSVSVDASSAKYDSTDSSIGVSGIPERTDYYLITQLRARDLVGTDSFSALQMRYQISEKSETTTLVLTNRFALFENWLIHPRLTATHRIYDGTDLEQQFVRPSLRIDYRRFKRFQLEAEVGYDWSTRETLRDDIDVTGLFFRVGYRARF